MQRKARNDAAASPKDYELVQKELLLKDAELLQRFYALTNSLSETELHAFLLLRYGLTKTEVGLLMAHSQQAITNICTRLFHKVSGRESTTSAEAYAWILKV